MVSVFTAAGQEILSPLLTIWNSFVTALPGIIFAAIILFLGYFVALLLGMVVQKLCNKAGIDKWMDNQKLNKSLGKLEVSHGLGLLVKWYVLLLFLSSAVQILQLGVLTTLLIRFVGWLPHLITAIVIMAFGLIIADFATDRIRATKIKGIDFVAGVVKAVVVLFMLIIALNEVGVDVSIAENTILIIVGAIALALALAVGIGFGFALKDDAKSMLVKLNKKL